MCVCLCVVQNMPRCQTPELHCVLNLLLVVYCEKLWLEDPAGDGDEGVLDKVEPHHRLPTLSQGHLAPGVMERIL